MSNPATWEAEFLINADDLLVGLRQAGVAAWRWRVTDEEAISTDHINAVEGSGSYDGTIAELRRTVHPDDFEHVRRALQEAVRNGTAYQVIFRAISSGDRRTRWMEARGGMVTDQEGKWLTGISLDVTHRVEAEQELQRRLHRQKAIENFGSFAFGESRLRTVAERATQVAAEVLEVPMAEVLQAKGEQLRLIAGVGWQDRASTEPANIDANGFFPTVMREGGPVILEDVAQEERFPLPEVLRSHGVASGVATAIAGEGARAFGVLAVYSRDRRSFDRADIEFIAALAHIIANSARQIAAVEHRALLVREMAHRAGNMLQLVNTLAHRTFSRDRDIDEAKNSFSSRLSSLARANYLVAKGGWSLTRFSDLAAETLDPFIDRMRLEGPDVLMPPELCFDLGLVLHELSTNAAKYGSLSSDRGTVVISWSLEPGEEDPRNFRLEWRDALSPKRQDVGGTGFGTRFMRLIIERKWGGTIEISSEDGYCFSFTIPLPSADNHLRG